MYLFIAGFFANLWADNAAVFLSCLLWGAAGLLVVSPFLLVDAVYHGHKTGNIYRFGMASHLVRRHYHRETVFFSIILLVSLMIVLAITA